MYLWCLTHSVLTYWGLNTTSGIQVLICSHPPCPHENDSNDSNDPFTKFVDIHILSLCGSVAFPVNSTAVPSCLETTISNVYPKENVYILIWFILKTISSVNSPTDDVFIIFSNLGLLLHVMHVSCVISNCGQHEWVLLFLLSFFWLVCYCSMWLYFSQWN